MIDDLKKADVIKRIVARNIEAKAWRSAAVEEATAYLDNSEKARRQDVVDYIRLEYNAAGANPLTGRW
jgi:hypothetical protein